MKALRDHSQSSFAMSKLCMRLPSTPGWFRGDVKPWADLELSAWTGYPGGGAASDGGAGDRPLTGWAGDWNGADV
jgi:hypothetical protein